MNYEDFEEKGMKLFADIEKAEKFEKNYMLIPVTAFNFIPFSSKSDRKSVV